MRLCSLQGSTEEDQFLIEDKMMNKSTVLGYAAALLLPALVMYGTGYNGTVDALIFTMVWIFLILGIFTIILVAIAGIAMAALGIGDEIPSDLKARMETCKKQLGRWWVTIAIVCWMLVSLASVGWTGTAVTYFLITLVSQIVMRLFVGTYNSLEKKLSVSTTN